MARASCGIGVVAVGKAGWGRIAGVIGRGTVGGLRSLRGRGGHGECLVVLKSVADGE